MRILMTADPMLPVPPKLYGGIERIIAMLVESLRGRDHTVALLAHRESTVDADAHYYWPNEGEGGWVAHAANARAMNRAIGAFAPDIVHSFSRLAYLGAHLLTRRPKLMCYQREPTPRTVRWAARLAGRSLHFSGCGEHIARRGAQAGGQWHAIPNCVDAMRYHFVEHVDPCAPLVFLSRIERIKGAHHAIAIARAAGRPLVIAGNRATSGEESLYFEREIAPHLDGEDVTYIGPVDDAQKNTLLGRAAAMLFPIEWEEPFGIVMIEALACGTPVIGFARGAVPEVIRDGREGFVVDNVAQAAVAVGRLSEIDRRDCRARVLEQYEAARVTERYEALYRQMVPAR